MGHTLLCVLGLFLLNTLLYGHAEVANKAVVTLQRNWSEIYEGETITLRCEIKNGGDTEWTYEWNTTSSNKTFDQNEVRIRSTDVSHSGDYRCLGRMKSGQMSSTDWSDPVRLTVSDRPQPVLTVSPSWLSPGDSVTLNCEVQHQSAGWRFYWYKVVPKLSDSSYSTEVLPDSISGTEQDSFIVHEQTHTAGYMCRAGRGDPVFYTQYSEPKFVWSADFKSSASLTVSPDRVQHFIKDSVSLNCEGDSAEWRVMMFTKNSHMFYYYSWKTVTGPTCNINSDQQSDAVYWCESESGEFSNAVNITVQDEDIILVSPVHPVTEGDSVSLSCKLRRQNFVSNVLFYQNGTIIQNDTRRELNISAVSKTDEGLYKCQHSGQESAQSWMSVKDEDIILVSPVHPVTEGDSVSLSCKLRRQNFVSNVFFYQNGTIIQNDTRRELNISAVSKSDEGFYKCQHSGQESAQSWMSVKAASRPESSSLPVLLIVRLVCGIVLIIILILLILYKPSKDSCFNRAIQSDSTNQVSDTNHVVDQNEAQHDQHSTLLHDDSQNAADSSAEL